jgi:hypothetical protein
MEMCLKLCKNPVERAFSEQALGVANMNVLHVWAAARARGLRKEDFTDKRVCVSLKGSLKPSRQMFSTVGVLPN